MKGTVFCWHIFTAKTNASHQHVTREWWSHGSRRTRITLHGEYRHRLQEKEINMNSFFPAKSEERFSPKKKWYACSKNCIIRWPLKHRFTFSWLRRVPVNEKCKGWTCRYIRAYFEFNSYRVYIQYYIRTLPLIVLGIR